MNKQTLIDSLDTFTNAYLECLLWSSMDESDEFGGSPMDENYIIEDITLDSLKSAIRDCKEFQAWQKELLSAQSDEQSGHDFWLTRNGHGAGFWDRGLGDVGNQLSKAAHSFGSVDAYVHKGKVHF